MNKPDVSRPGKTPAINNLPMERSANAATKIMVMLGGMRGPREPPAQMLPTERYLEYPRFFISGYAIIPIITVAVEPDPVVAANRVETPTVAAAKPPRRPANHFQNAS